MNPFEGQLVMYDGKTLAEHHNEGRGWDRDIWLRHGPVKTPPPPRKVTVEEFERDR